MEGEVVEFWTLMLALTEKEKDGGRKGEVSTDGIHMERATKPQNDGQISRVLH